MRFLQKLLVCVALITSTHTSAAVNCEKAMSSSGPSFLVPAVSALSGVTLEDLDLSQAKLLTPQGVFVIPHKTNGEKYVLRFQTQNDKIGSWQGEELRRADIAYEVFATRLGAQLAHHVEVNPVVRVSDSSAEKALTTLLQDDANKHVKRERVMPVASLSLHMPLKTVAYALPHYYSNTYFMGFWSALDDLARSGEVDPNFQSVLDKLRWDFYDRNQFPHVRVFREALAVIFPEVKFDQVSKFNTIFFGTSPLIMATNGDIEFVYRQIFTLLPDGLLKYAAEHWAIANILGLIDSDAHNALWDGSHYVAIDMACKTSRFLSGQEHPNLGAQSAPFNRQHDFNGTYNAVIGKVLMDELSDEFIAGLSTVSRDDVMKYADEAGLEISRTWVDGVMKRIENFRARQLGPRR